MCQRSYNKSHTIIDTGFIILKPALVTFTVKLSSPPPPTFVVDTLVDNPDG